jgi:DNA invertase Pin-like site-specific DNA recombinase
LSTANCTEFKKLFADAYQRKFDLVLFWSLDRFSHEGALPTLQHLSLLESYGVGYKSYTEQYLDSTGIFKDAVISILAIVAKPARVRLNEHARQHRAGAGQGHQAEQARFGARAGRADTPVEGGGKAELRHWQINETIGYDGSEIHS